tara:strand:- start:657 stop:1232 length:576 start_codon:yes stop_codon:yes gene_type:complete
LSDIADEDAACVRSILTGRPEQFRELVNRYQDSVFAILSRYERDRGLVEDMAQAVFLKAWRHLKKFDPLKAPFENWLSRMATNTALNHVRDEKHFRDQVPISQLNEGALEWLQQEDESSPLESMEAREILNRCMVGLSPDEQIILTMTEIEGRTSPEISQLTGKAAGTIRVTLHRAKQKIAKNLKHLQELK